jgi:MFS family permease
MKISAYRYYLLAVLAVVYAFNLTDLWAIGMSLQSIKHELHLSDTELGFVSGIAFFLFYSAFGVPMGRWADRGDRVTILSLTRLLWSAFVVFTGHVTSFAQLLLVRMGAGVGEAGCLPAAYSMISEYFSRAERPQAMGLFFMSVPFSTLLGYMGVGWLLEFYSWRSVFTLIGLSGVVLAPLAWLTLREPRRGRSRPEDRSKAGGADDGGSPPKAAEGPPSLSVAFRSLWANVTYRNLAAAIVANYLFGAGIYQWLPSYFMRSFELKSGILGLWLSLMSGVPGMVGNFAGGRLASRRAAGNERLQLAIIAIVNCSLGILMSFVYLSRNYVVALGMLGLWYMAAALCNAPILSAMQLVVPARLRGMSIMLAFFFANLIGSGLGPIAVGALSDLLRPAFGVDSLRYALLIMSPWYLWGGWHLWRASKSVARDIRVIESLEECNSGHAVTGALSAEY